MTAFTRPGHRYFGDCREVMRSLIANSCRVQMCVTSPPYWGLRDYGTPGQLGLERTYQEYVENMVEVFRLVRDLLHDDGLLWLNLGDSYATGAGVVGERPGGGAQGDAWNGHRGSRGGSAKQPHTGNAVGPLCQPIRLAQPGLKPKDLAGIPWRVAFALQADGWYLRQDIIWHKPNPMPESVRDRCTKSHEYLFLLAKSERYYFDADAIAEPVTLSTIERVSQPGLAGLAGSDRVPGKTNGPMKAVIADPRRSRNGSTFDKGKTGEMMETRGGLKQRKPAGWDTGPGAHGAFHRAARAATVEYTEVKPKKSGNVQRKAATERGCPRAGVAGNVPWEGYTRNKRSVWTVTTKPFKGAHFATFPPNLIEPCILAGSRPGDTVLDPFFGSGTTGEVAQRFGRYWGGIELNEEYRALQLERTRQQGMVYA